MNTAFHEVIFPLTVAFGAQGGPERRTDVVTLGSGAEERNARWRHSRRKYNAGYGIRNLDDLQAVVAFFEERRGRLHGFRFRDPFDGSSALPGRKPSPFDQEIGRGDGQTAVFQLIKRYGSGPEAYLRPIHKPCPGTVKLAVGNVPLSLSDTMPVSVDFKTGLVTFAPDHLPPPGARITAGFLFDVPVRFDTDYLVLNLSHFQAGTVPEIPLLELKL